MYVMNKKWDSVTNIAQCTSVYVSPEHEIKAVPTGGRAGHQACAAGCFEPERNFPPHERNLSKQKEDCLRNPPRKAILLYLN